MDVYVSKKEGETWGKPINLGKQINTELDEMYPYIDSDTLYFSSKGMKGFGGADIYKSTINGTSYGEPKNMGKPYNSSKDDFSFIINMPIAFKCSRKHKFEAPYYYVLS